MPTGSNGGQHSRPNFAHDKGRPSEKKAPKYRSKISNAIPGGSQGRSVQSQGNSRNRGSEPKKESLIAPSPHNVCLTCKRVWRGSCASTKRDRLACLVQAIVTGQPHGPTLQLLALQTTLRFHSIGIGSHRQLLIPNLVALP